jgi:hypothetical protein
MACVEVPPRTGDSRVPPTLSIEDRSWTARKEQKTDTPANSPAHSPQIVAHSDVTVLVRRFCNGQNSVYNGLSLWDEMKKLDSSSRRWTVIASGLLCGALALVVLFTNRGAFFSPLAVVVMGAVGLAAVLLQLRLQNKEQAQSSSSPAWLNVLGIVFALAAFFVDLFHVNAQVTEALALGAVASFGVSGVIILRSFRKRATSK